MQIKSIILVLVFLLCWDHCIYSNSNLTFPPPSNDNCENATDLGLIECLFYLDVPPDPGATPDLEATGNCIDNTEAGQWFTFTTPSPMTYGALMHFSNDVKVEIFSTTSDCSDLTFVDCGVGPFGFKPEPATTYYYLTVGGLHMQPPTSGLSSCGDFLATFDFTQSPLNTASYTDCAAYSADVVCENDHVIWFEYTVGCGESSDVTISVSDFTADPDITANEISITAALFDCSTQRNRSRK